MAVKGPRCERVTEKQTGEGAYGYEEVHGGKKPLEVNFKLKFFSATPEWLLGLIISRIICLSSSL